MLKLQVLWSLHLGRNDFLPTCILRPHLVYGTLLQIFNFNHFSIIGFYLFFTVSFPLSFLCLAQLYSLWRCKEEL